jgi:DNA-binding transcriptional ArsR family regulator
MTDRPGIALPAALIGNPTRSSMLCSLKELGALSATDLARIAGVAPSTASEQLSKLTQAGVIAMERRGRHRFYRLAFAEVSDALEALEVLAMKARPQDRVKSRGDHAIWFARSCYDHLAGTAGVRLLDALLERGYLEQTDDGHRLLQHGKSGFNNLGIDLEEMAAGRRPLLRLCQDWSESGFHVGGALGAGLFDLCCEQGWLKRQKMSRAVQITPRGRMAFKSQLGLEI